VDSTSIQLPRLKIVHIMLIAGVFAIVFGVLSTRPEESLFGLTLLIAIGCVWFVVRMLRVNPLKVVLAQLPENTDEKIAALEDGLARCNRYDVSTNSLARYRLMELYKVRKRYQDAIDQCKSILAMKGVNHELEDEVRVEIAVCLDFLGRSDEAAMERMTVTGETDDRPDGFLGWRARGKALEKQHRNDEAIEAYEKAFELASFVDKAGRDELFVRLVLTSFNAGKPDVTLAWAERAIAAGVAENQLYQVHRMAGVACSNLGRLEDAQQHHQRSYELALRQGDSAKIVDCLATLAEVHRLRGELDSAEALCVKAESLAPATARAAIMVHAIVLKTRGQIDEAVARMRHASQVGGLAMASNEQRIQAALKLRIAIYRAELGRVDEAWEELSAASAEIGSDPKLTVPCEAAWSFLLALRSDREAAVRRTELVLKAFDERPDDRSIQLDCLDLMGRATLAAGEVELAQRYWERYLAIPPPPVGRPTGHYHLGECRWRLNDPAGAELEFHRAATMGIDSQHARLAQARLREFLKAGAKGNGGTPCSAWTDPSA
jgi:tetratricopeptide (TPR) repeat protein